MEEKRLVKTFSGGYILSLDAKNRLSIPASFQRILSAIDSKNLFVAFGIGPQSRGSKARFLEIWPDKHWRKHAARILAERRRATGLRVNYYEYLVHFYIHPALQVSPDKQWRIVLPAAIRKYLGIQKNPNGEDEEPETLYLVGSGQYMKLYRFDEFIAEMDAEREHVDAYTVLREIGAYLPEEDYYADAEDE